MWLFFLQVLECVDGSVGAAEAIFDVGDVAVCSDGSACEFCHLQAVFEGLEDLAKGVLADGHEPDLVHLSGGEHPRGGQHVSDVWGVERTPQDGNSHFFPFPTALPQATTTIVEDEGRAPKTRE